MDRAYSGSAASLPLSTILFSKGHTEVKKNQPKRQKNLGLEFFLFQPIRSSDSG